MDKTPQENKIILGVSSMWIYILINQSYIYQSYFMVFLFLNMIIASPLYWYHHNMYSYSYYYDLTSVSIYGIILFYNTLILYNLYILSIFSGLVLFFYYLSDYYLHKQLYTYQLLCHILFRYIFFIWSYLYINNFDKYLYLTFISINYFLYNFYLYKRIKKYNLVIYLQHCIQILLLSIFYEYLIKL